MRLNEHDLRDHRPSRRVRRVGLLAEHLGHAVGDRALGLADRRPPPDRQLLRAGRSDRDDADVHGLGAGAAREGKYAGTRVFEAEEADGLALMRGSDAPSSARRRRIGDDAAGRRLHHGASATTSSSATRASRYDELTPEQQRAAAASWSSVYVGRMRPGHAEVKLDEVQRHLDETYFAWIGAVRRRRASSTTASTAR